MKNNRIWSLMVALLLVASSTFVLVDTFLVAHVGDVVYVEESDVQSDITSQNQASTTNTTTTSTTSTTSTASLTTTSTTSSSDGVSAPSITMTDGYYAYEDDTLTIEITTEYANNATYYVAEIITEDPSLLKTALAEDTYGQNIIDTTSSIAEAHDAIFAINGDYYGFRSTGLVMRNGQILRTTIGNATSGDALLLLENGGMVTMSESDVTQSIVDSLGVEDILSFGPTLLEDGQIINSTSKNSQRDNPRTAIGMISENHYIIIVVDGRTSMSAGMTTTEVAEIFKDLGCTTPIT